MSDKSYKAFVHNFNDLDDVMLKCHMRMDAHSFGGFRMSEEQARRARERIKLLEVKWRDMMDTMLVIQVEPSTKKEKEDA